MLEAMKNEKGVHIESLLCALGALAGYSCQASLRAQAIAKGLPETDALVVVAGENGQSYFFGDPLNQALLESQYSVWALAAGQAQNLGARTLPDAIEIIKHVTATVGKPEFGAPRMPEGHEPTGTPLSHLKTLWPLMLPVAQRFCPTPPEWPVLFGLAIQETMAMGQSVIEPTLALSVVMESAVPMSKVDLAAT